MEICMDILAMQYFLDLTGLKYTLDGILLTLHATSGDVTYIWDGWAFCLNKGESA